MEQSIVRISHTLACSFARYVLRQDHQLNIQPQLPNARREEYGQGLRTVTKKSQINELSIRRRTWTNG